MVDGYGHVSVRHPADPQRYLMSRSIAPELVTVADVMEYDLDSTTVDARGRTSYLERFIHGEIYRVRPDVLAIVHNHSPSVIPFGVSTPPLRPLYHMSAFLGGGVPVFDIRKASSQPTDMLVRDAALGRALAQTLGTRPVALMRGHGCVVVGTSLPIVVFRSVYTEMNARLQAQAMALGAGDLSGRRGGQAGRGLGGRHASRGRGSCGRRRPWPGGDGTRLADVLSVTELAQSLMAWLSAHTYAVVFVATLIDATAIPFPGRILLAVAGAVAAAGERSATMVIAFGDRRCHRHRSRLVLRRPARWRSAAAPLLLVDLQSARLRAPHH